MDTLISCLWIAAGLAMMVYLVFRNRKYTRVLTSALELTEDSVQRCEHALLSIQTEHDRTARGKLLGTLDQERTRIHTIFQCEKEWPGQAKRIKAHLERVDAYIDAGRALVRNGSSHDA
jgi:hypothetical protein